MFNMIFGAGVAEGLWTFQTPYTHANVLRTIEDGLGLGNLSQADAAAVPIQGFWK
jgi:hypothetical protein